MMMTMMMCDLWQLIGLLCNCQVSLQLFTEWNDSGFTVMLEGLLVKKAQVALHDVRGTKHGLNDFLHPTSSKRTGLQTSMEMRSTS